MINFLRKIVSLSILGMFVLPTTLLAGHHPGSTDGPVSTPAPVSTNGVAETASAGSSTFLIVIVVVLVITIGLWVKNSKKKK